MHAVKDKKFDFISVIALFGICQQEFSYEYWLAISCNWCSSRQQDMIKAPGAKCKKLHGDD